MYFENALYCGTFGNKKQTSKISFVKQTNVAVVSLRAKIKWFTFYIFLPIILVRGKGESAHTLCYTKKNHPAIITATETKSLGLKSK